MPDRPRSGGAGSTPSAGRRSSDWPPPDSSTAPRPDEREVVDRRGGLGRRGGRGPGLQRRAVLAVCADALRRRELVERAARPARFGGGEVAIASGAARRRRQSRRRGRRVPRPAPAWCSPTGPRWRASPSSPPRFEHVVVIDPPPFAAPRAAGVAGSGYLHLVWRRGRARVRAARPRRGVAEPRSRWRPRSDCPAPGAGGRCIGRWRPDRALASRCDGAARHPRSPEVAARRLRVLERARARRLAGVRHRIAPSASYPRRGRISSDSPAFVAYRDALRGGQAIPERAKTTELEQPEGASEAASTPDATGRRTNGAKAPATARVTPGSAPVAARPAGRAGHRARSGPGRRRARAARRPARGDRRAQRRAATRQIDREAVERAFAFACERHADQRRTLRRGLHHPPGRGGEDLRRPAPRHRDAVRGAAARHGRGHERQPRRGRGAVRRADRPARRRRHEAHRDHLPEPRREPGRELPQDDGRDGHGRPGHPDQARRPPPQHAHAVEALPKQKQIEKARETLEIYAPLAHRLGIHAIKWELEDLSFQRLHPRKYDEIKKLVSQQRAERERYVDRGRRVPRSAS